MANNPGWNIREFYESDIIKNESIVRYDMLCGTPTGVRVNGRNLLVDGGRQFSIEFKANSLEDKSNRKEAVNKLAEKAKSEGFSENDSQALYIVGYHCNLLTMEAN